MARIVFLDIDGVLNTYANPVGRFSAGEPAEYLDAALVARVNRLTGATGAQIVVISDWRWFFTFPELRGALRKAGVRGPVVGATPMLAEPRRDEIRAWFEANGVPESFVIVDDDHEFEVLEARRVRTDRMVGLTDRDVDRAIGMLEQEDGEFEPETIDASRADAG